MFNDLKAPRFNPRKLWVDIVTRPLYREFKRTYKMAGGFKNFRKTWDLIAAEIKLSIIEERDGVRLPSGLGDIYIGFVRAKEGKERKIDYKTSAEINKKVYHDGITTGGKTIHIIHGTSDRKYIHRRKRWWSFSAVRDFKRSVSRQATLNPERYKDSQEKKYKVTKYDRSETVDIRSQSRLRREQC